MLYEIFGYWAEPPLRGWPDVTVLEVQGEGQGEVTAEYIRTEPMDGGVRVVLRGNAVTREDLQAMFKAGGLI